MKMLFEVENKQPVQVQDFAKVEKSLRALKSYGPQSFASLSKSDGSYIQVAGGRVTCVLEMREKPSDQHLRAYLEKPKVPFEGRQTLRFGGGHITMEPDEMLFIDDVVAAFKSFFHDLPLPENLRWRDISHLLRSRPEGS